MSRKPTYRRVSAPRTTVRTTVCPEVSHVRNRLRGRRWRKFRRTKLQEQPLCEQCQRTGRIVAATEVDHIRPSRGDADLHWDWENLQSLCRECHARKTAKESAGKEPR